MPRIFHELNRITFGEPHPTGRRGDVAGAEIESVYLDGKIIGDLILRPIDGTRACWLDFEFADARFANFAAPSDERGYLRPDAERAMTTAILTLLAEDEQYRDPEEPLITAHVEAPKLGRAGQPPMPSRPREIRVRMGAQQLTLHGARMTARIFPPAGPERYGYVDILSYGSYFQARLSLAFTDSAGVTAFEEHDLGVLPARDPRSASKMPDLIGWTTPQLQEEIGTRVETALKQEAAAHNG